MISQRFTAGPHVLPAFIYGTAWKEADTVRCVEAALAAGFRGIDTANQRKHYDEAAVGAALQKVLAQGQLTRRDLFIQTKFTYQSGQDHRLPYDPSAAPRDQVEQSLASSLEHLQVEHLDALLLHGPSTPDGWSALDRETWRAMEACHRTGKVKLLGVSNISSVQLQALWAEVDIPPAIVQNRCFARTGWDQQVRRFCRQHSIVYQGFSLLTANAEVWRHPGFAALVRQTGATPAQVIFRFAMQIGILPITGTTSPAHMREDLDCVAFELDQDDLNSIEFLLG